ncbi:precorrin-6A synthase (deacetylating) [Reyranella sp.]|uniref:precorrin-6A synthase (deacetylating) n=1 Tax=Reyranella sp. TaxID=1929291 RepID=UPI002F92C401
MKKILIIGVGAGDPRQVTIEAVEALNRVDVFFVLEKGAIKQDMVALRLEILRRYIKDRPYRVVEAPSPPRERAPANYLASVDALNRDKQAAFARMIAAELADGQCGGILAWGDPALYDSTIRNVEAIAAAGKALDYEVIPGISSIQILAARHRITLNRIGQSVEITTGRLLTEGWPDHADSVVVMLDGEETYNRFADQAIEIFWGAYLGTPDEILIAGRLEDVAADINRARRHAREAHGWIMDTYLMRRVRP